MRSHHRPTEAGSSARHRSPRELSSSASARAADWSDSSRVTAKRSRSSSQLRSFRSRQSTEPFAAPISLVRKTRHSSVRAPTPASKSRHPYCPGVRGRSSLPGSRGQPGPDDVVGLPPASGHLMGLHRLSGEGSGLFLGLSLFTRERHPFTNDGPAHPGFGHLAFPLYDRVARQPMTIMRACLQSAHPHIGIRDGFPAARIGAT